jgi:iron complex outermembrane receptor protein
MKHLSVLGTGDRKPEKISILFLLLFLTNSLTFSQQKIVTDTISSEKRTEDEIVNIGYGTQKKREVTSSVTSIQSENFNKGNINNPLQLIQGKVAGVDISKPGGDPNGLFYIRIRGLSTINCNTLPLVIIDGMIEGSLDNVDPTDIESINILKDGSAAAIYGTRGANGVILVTTKKGKKGTALIDYNVYTSAEIVAKNEPAMNAAEWRSLSKKTGFGTDFGSTTDWFRQIEQTAFSLAHNLSVSGGTDKTIYRASVNYRKDEGVEINTGYNQLNGRINISQKALNDKLTLDLNLGATERESQYGFAEAFRYAAISNPTSPVKSNDPAFVIYDGYFQQILFDYYNPVQIVREDINEGKNKILNMSLKATYEILRSLSIDALYSRENSGTLGGQYFNSHDYWGGMNRSGLASRQQDNSTNSLFESVAHFNRDFNSSLNLNLIAGYSYQDFTNEGFSAQGGNFLIDDFTFNNLAAALDFKNGKGKVTSYKNSNKLVAYFGRVNMSINNIWFVSASARYEGSSLFSLHNKWGFYPAIGGGIDISKLLGVSFIDNLKIRTDYGVTGNLPLLRSTNTDQKPEKIGELDAGFDFSLFSNKVYGSFDYYASTTKDLLVQVQVPVPPNLYGQQLMNIGKLSCSGLELSINLNVLKKSDFSYIVNFSPSYTLENTLVSLSGTYNGTVLKLGIQDLGTMGAPAQNQVPLTRIEEGKPVGQLLALVFNNIDANGNITFVDINKDGRIDANDRQIVGNGLPKFLFGFGNELMYRNWDLNVFFRGVFGHDLINTYRALYEVPNYITTYNLPKTAAELRNPSTGKLLNASSGTFTSKDVENASFISLDNMSLGYSFHLKESSQFRKMRLYLAGNNLFYFTKYKGSDPNQRYTDLEDVNNSPLIPGVDRMTTWPRTRSVTFGANVMF